MKNKKLDIIIPEEENPFKEAKDIIRSGFCIDNTIRLPENPEIKDIMDWVFKVSEKLNESKLPAAWAAASANMLKAAMIMKELAPPEIPDVKPRPRKAIIIEEDD